MTEPIEHKICDSNEYIFPPGTMRSINWPKPTWRWDMFGGQQMVVTLMDSQPEPSWWQRTATRLLFGSKWQRVQS